MSVKVLVVTKGHPFDYNGFYAMFDENPELLTTQVEQPAAQVMLRPENVAEYEAVCFYDMWGTESPDGGASFVPAPEEYQQSIAALLREREGHRHDEPRHRAVARLARLARRQRHLLPPDRGRGLRRDDPRLRLPRRRRRPPRQPGPAPSPPTPPPPATPSSTASTPSPSRTSST